MHWETEGFVRLALLQYSLYWDCLEAKPQYFVETPVQQFPLLSVRETFQDPQWMPEIVNSTKPHKYHVISYIYISMLKLNL